MNFLSFFKKAEKTGKESAVDSTEILDSVEVSTNLEEVETTLSYHPSWRVSQEQEYVFRFLSNELEPLKPNQISLSGIEVDEEPGTNNWLVKAFFRSSLDETIQMSDAELLLIDENEEVIATQQFDLSELGDIPPKSARPWVFVFTKDNLTTETRPTENWRLAFNVQSMAPHRLDLAESWEEQLSEEQKESLEKIVQDFPKLKPKEVNFVGFQVAVEEDGSIPASVFIRNGHSKDINLEQLPLELYDMNEDLVASGTFKLEDFTVKANTTKPWTFIFPKSLVKKDNPDFSSWVIRVKQ